MLGADQVLKTALWYDNTGNGRAIAAYQPVVYATAAEVSTLGKGVVGDVVVVPPITSSKNTKKIAGVTLNSALNGEEVTIVIGGIAEVMMNAATAWDEQTGWLFVAAVEARTSAQTPLTNMFEALIPADPRLTITYQLALAARTAVTPADAGANAAYYPLGYPLDAATAKYDVIRVELDTGLRYA